MELQMVPLLLLFMILDSFSKFRHCKSIFFSLQLPNFICSVVTQIHWQLILYKNIFKSIWTLFWIWWKPGATKTQSYKIGKSWIFSVFHIDAGCWWRLKKSHKITWLTLLGQILLVCKNFASKLLPKFRGNNTYFGIFFFWFLSNRPCNSFLLRDTRNVGDWIHAVFM